MAYFLTITKDGDIIAEREATPEMVIALLAEMVTGNPSAEGEPITPPKVRDEAVPHAKKSARHCSNCGGTGHTTRTCTGSSGKPAHTKSADQIKLNEDQFDALKYLQSIGDLISKDFAQKHDLPLAQVNRAIACRNFEEYLDS